MTTPSIVVHWYAIGCGLFGCLGLVVGLTACAYQWYRRRTSPTTRLSSAIHKGLMESKQRRESVMHKSSSTLSAGSTSRSSGQLTEPPDPPEKTDPTIPSPSGRPSDTKTGYHLEDEGDNKRVNSSPVDKDYDDNRREKSDDDPKSLGTLEFVIVYDEIKSSLVVSIVRACALPAKDRVLCTSDPYVKLQLLPERRHKVKTRVLRKTLNPTYDEAFTFYGIDVNQLAATTLHFVVLSFDRFSRDDIIGEVIYPLAVVDLVEDRPLSVCRNIAPRHIKVGQLFQQVDTSFVALLFVPKSGVRLPSIQVLDYPFPVIDPFTDVSAIHLHSVLALSTPLPNFSSHSLPNSILLLLVSFHLKLSFTSISSLSSSIIRLSTLFTPAILLTKLI